MGWYEAIKDVLRFCTSRLSEHERDLLMAASDLGDIHTFTVDGYGTWIQIDQRQFSDDDDRAVAARYMEALERLCSRGLVKQEFEQFYRLTGTGFDCGRRMKAQHKTKPINRP